MNKATWQILSFTNFAEGYQAENIAMMTGTHEPPLCGDHSMADMILTLWQDAKKRENI